MPMYQQRAVFIEALGTTQAERLIAITQQECLNNRLTALVG